MNKEKAHELITERSKCCLRTTKHCRERMIQRNIVMDDIRYVIHWGEVIDVSWSQDYGNWICKIHGKDIEEEEFTLVAAILDDSILCITVTE